MDIWLKKEEGMFRVSGRNSHVTRLRKEFDSGELVLYSVGSLPDFVGPQAPTSISSFAILEMSIPTPLRACSRRI